MNRLFESLNIGGITTKNRIFLAPLTRSRANADGTHRPLAATYYSQRASAGLLISEAIAVSKQGSGYVNIPGLWNEAQVESWRPITTAVHSAGGNIFAQLFHTGRIGHSSLFGEQPVAPTAIRPEGEVMNAAYAMGPFETPRELSAEEIPGIVQQFRIAAKHAIDAGFDGIEIHGANGYLIDQFLRDGTNRRTDAYGGSTENRVRFLREVLLAVAAEIGADRVGLRLSPHNSFNSMTDSNPQETFVAAARVADEIGIAYLHVIEPEEILQAQAHALLPELRKRFRNPIVVNGGYTSETSEAALGSGLVDAVAFGQAFLANPDLPERLRTGAALNPADPATFYGGDEHGYTDYPSLELAIAS